MIHATVQLSTVPQGGYAPVQLGAQVKPATVQLGAQVKPATVQLGAQVKPATVQLGSQVTPQVQYLGAQVAPASGAAWDATTADGDVKRRHTNKPGRPDKTGKRIDERPGTSNIKRAKTGRNHIIEVLGDTLTANATKIAERIKAATTTESAFGEYLQGSRNLKLAGGDAAYQALVETPSAAIGKVTGVTIDKLGNVVTASRNLGLTPEMQQALEKTAGDNALLLSQFSAAQIDQMKQAYADIEQRQQEGTQLVLRSLYENAGLPTPLKLVPLASTDKNSAIAEMEWRAGKYSLNDVIPRIDVSVHQALIEEELFTDITNELEGKQVGYDTEKNLERLRRSITT